MPLSKPDIRFSFFFFFFGGALQEEIYSYLRKLILFVGFMKMLSSLTMNTIYRELLTHLVVNIQSFSSNALLYLHKMELLQRDENNLKN